MDKQDHTSEISKLIALKKYEQPSDEFFDQFHAEFRERQRQEMLQQSAHELFIERLATWFSCLGRVKWAYAGGAAFAAIALLFTLQPDDQQVPTNRLVVQPASNANSYEPMEHMQVVDLRPQAMPVGELQVF
ncbi:hypothetical protein [Persicirhabdus sediminis]|uniref:Uncharacterized protein n=1 Tax=Persicirhabdus sediminis TaxID=454144 RepID=A0A8J7SL39_9BACT|nr:hypothetical protein [Persicirhabdus sediminis]MBK1792539.1 hypothetical protein [Persicirhabdus sediminis]